MFFTKKIVDWLIPFTCIFCHEQTKISRDLCLNCELNLPWLQNSCYQCGEKISGFSVSFSHTLKCGNCLKIKPPYDHTIALFDYQSPIDHMIIQLKFYEKLIYARLLGELMAKYLIQNSEAFPELIIPVPLHPKRLKERGFNQALEISKILKKRLKVPVWFQGIERIRQTTPQSAIPATERNKNLKNAFYISQKFNVKHVAIVDDVMTTGATVAALSHALRKNGIQKVDVWVCARAHLNH